MFYNFHWLYMIDVMWKLFDWRMQGGVRRTATKMAAAPSANYANQFVFISPISLCSLVSTIWNYPPSGELGYIFCSVAIHKIQFIFNSHAQQVALKTGINLDILWFHSRKCGYTYLPLFSKPAICWQITQVMFLVCNLVHPKALI